MSGFIYFTEEQKQRARTTNLVALLERQGHKLKKSGKEYQWNDGSDKVTIKGNLWFHQYERVGGDAIDFIRKFDNKTYAEAVKYLLEENGEIIQAPESEPVEKKPFELPKRNDNMRRAYAYLLTARGIDRNIINAFVHKDMIYESAPYHNVVFVGYDNEGKAVHAHKRGSGSKTTFKGNQESSIPEFSFHWNGTGDKLFLFEAPIDMLSYISMNQNEWQKNTYAAACSVSDLVLFQCLKDNPNIKNIYLCLDNDEAGQKAVKRISEKLYTLGYKAEVLTPIHKDWNEDLLSLKESETQCQTLSS